MTPLDIVQGLTSRVAKGKENAWTARKIFLLRSGVQRRDCPTKETQVSGKRPFEYGFTWLLMHQSSEMETYIKMCDCLFGSKGQINAAFISRNMRIKQPRKPVQSGEECKNILILIMTKIWCSYRRKGKRSKKDDLMEIMTWWTREGSHSGNCGLKWRNGCTTLVCAVSLGNRHGRSKQTQTSTHFGREYVRNVQVIGKTLP